MRFCDRHWALMRAAVEARGLTPLVSEGGRAAVERTVSELVEGPAPDNFDPLMAMHWNIATNMMERLGPSGLYLLTGGPEDPIDVARIADEALRAKYRGRTWPRCPLCYANITHEITCREVRCRLARVDGWDACIEWSADVVRQEFDRMMAEGRAVR